MTSEHQKSRELMYAEQTGKLLGKSWKIEPAPDEVSWPDLLVTTEFGKFGLEVREIFLDECCKGSRRKASEINNLKKVRNLANAYYRESRSSINVQFLNDIDHHDRLLYTLFDEVKKLSEWQQKRVVPYDGSIIYIRKLPDTFGIYNRWTYVSDMCGWVVNIDPKLINKSILDKAKRLPKYTKNISDVSLLLVSNRIFNSGKLLFQFNIITNVSGFTNVYYLSYPEEAWVLA